MILAIEYIIIVICLLLIVDFLVAFDFNVHLMLP